MSFSCQVFVNVIGPTTLASVLLTAGPARALRVLDDFRSNDRFGWNDFTFGTGKITQAPGQLTFQIPASVQQPTFIASVRQTEWFQIPETQALEFRAELSAENAADTLAGLAWIPESQPPTAFAGYFIAKSPHDILIGKAVHKYFYRAPLPAAVTNQSIAMVLSLSRTNDDVVIEGKLLDPGFGDAVLFQQSFSDTVQPDQLAMGLDDPPAPYSGRGRFALIAYSEMESGGPDPRELDFAGAWVSSPPPQNLLPVIDDASISNRASFVEPSTHDISFSATSDQPWDLLDGFAVALGSGVVTASFGYASPTDLNRLVADAGIALGTNSEYSLRLLASTRPQVSNDTRLAFDTFSTTDPVIEAEDYNFNGGQFLDVPVLTPEGTTTEPDSYRGQAGVTGVDFQFQGKSSSLRYRPLDHIALKQSLDYLRPKFVDAGGPPMGFYDYDISGLTAGDYFNYSRFFETGFFKVYLRESVVNMAESTALLELVTNDPSQPYQLTQTLGYFRGQGSDFLFTNVPLVDTSGRNVVVHLSGVATLRLRQASTRAGTPHLESATSVTGPFKPELAASVDLQKATIQVTNSPSIARYYRIRSDVPTRITGIRLSSGDVAIIGFAPLGN